MICHAQALIKGRKNQYVYIVIIECIYGYVYDIFLAIHKSGKRHLVLIRESFKIIKKLLLLASLVDLSIYNTCIYQTWKL